MIIRLQKSLFKTCKYRPNWPTEGFNSLEKARQWVLRFTHWYNMEHKHSKLRFVTPNERHAGEDKAILAKRKQTMEEAKALNPVRWGSRAVRDCTPVPPTTLNPVKALKSVDEMSVA